MPLTERDLIDVQRLARVYADAEARIMMRLAAALQQGVEAPSWETDVLARVQRLREEATNDLASLNENYAREIEAKIASLYQGASAEMLRDIGQGLEPQQISSTQQRSAVKRLVREMTQGAASAGTSLLRVVDDAFREIVSDVVTSVVARGESKRDALKRATQTVFARGLPTFTDTKGRRWNAQDYVNMATRTGYAAAQIQGHEDALDANGLDLVIIQPGPRACPICDEWARKVLSRSGQTGTYYATNALTGKNTSVKIDGTLAEARKAGFQHPNCRCSLRAFIPGVTQRSDINRPPYDAEGYARQQQQRGMEKSVRDAKIALANAQISGDPKAIAKAKQRLAQKQGALRDHLAANPYLKRRSDREQILGVQDGGTPARPRKPQPSPSTPNTPEKTEKIAESIAAEERRVEAPPSQRDLMARFSRTEPETPEVAATKTNPYRSLTRDYATNCHYCAPAVELRARGYNVRARPTVANLGRVDTDIANDWREPGGGKRDFTRLNELGGTTRAALNALAAAMPEGARGFMAGAWKKGGGGHIFNWEKRDGRIVMHEGQIESVKSIDAGLYPTQMQFGSVTWMRVDDMEPHEGAAFAVQPDDDPVDERTTSSELARAERELVQTDARIAEYRQEQDDIEALLKRLDDRERDLVAAHANGPEIERLQGRIDEADEAVKRALADRDIAAMTAASVESRQAREARERLLRETPGVDKVQSERLDAVSRSNTLTATLSALVKRRDAISKHITQLRRAMG